MSLKDSGLSRGLHWSHWGVVIASLGLTIVAWYISSAQLQQRVLQRFDFQSKQLLSQVSERMSHYEDALQAGVAAIRSQSQGIDVDEWQRFASTLKLEERYPGINGIGVIFYVSPTELEGFLQNERILRPDFILHPAHDSPEYWPITYIEPVNTNRQAVGLDIAFEDNRLTAAKKSRDTGTTQITAAITLVQDAKKTPGFLQYVPIYQKADVSTVEDRRKHFIGHVYAPFIVYKLMEGTLAQSHRQLIFRVKNKGNILYNELTQSNTDFELNPLLKKSVTLNMYGQPWLFDIQTTRTFRESETNHQPIFILIGGIVIDGLLLLLFLLLARSKQKSVLLAEKMTRKFSVSEAYFRHIIETAPCGMVITNSTGIIEKVNPHAQMLFGYDERELLGCPVDILVPESLREKHAKDRQNFLSNPDRLDVKGGRNTSGLKKDGKLFAAEISLAKFSGEDEVKTLATVIDMSEYLSITNELKRSNKELNDFAYVASHDLKAPLRGIMQLSNWIADDIDSIANDDTKENLELLQSRVSRLEKLLDDLLSYSRIGRKHGEMRQVDIRKLFEDIYDLLSPPKTLKLVCKEPLIEITTLSSPLEIIIRNLLGNAIKHHHSSNGQIQVSMTESSQAYIFSICDDGPGIPPKHHRQIFELFKTLKPRDEVEGSGMGLSIIKKLLDYYGGTIEVISDGKKGTCFRFTWLKNL